MALISDFLLAAGAFGAAIYCVVLSRRLAKFSTLENGMGGAIAVLSAQVDAMTKVLQQAGAMAQSSSASLEGLTARAEEVAGRLELMLASMHDLPEPPKPEEAGKRARFLRRHVSRPEGADLEAAE